MGTSHTLKSSYELQLIRERNQIQALRDLSKSLKVLACRTPDEKRTRIHFPTRQVLLKFINNYRSSDDDNDADMTIVDAICNLITQHVLQWMPKKFLSETCPVHAGNCICLASGRENFVLSRLTELGLDTVKLKHIIEKAYIMSLERNPPPAQPRVKRPAAPKSPIVWRPLRAPARNQQPVGMRASSQSLYQDIQRPVIVEYIPSTNVTVERLSPPYRI